MTATAQPAAASPKTFEERTALGRSARARTPRRSQGDWAPATNRPDPVAILEEESATRVPELVPIRYGRMLVSPFTFYRGAAAIMAADLAPTSDSGLHAQLCGDAHLSNFGVYAAPDRRLVFDVNDFDETHPGPWEWDVKRLVASLEIAGRHRAYKSRQRRAIVLAAARAYRDAMRSFATMGHLEVWYTRVDVERIMGELQGHIAARDLQAAQRRIEKARAKDSTRALAKLTTRVDGRLQFLSQPPLLVRAVDLIDDTVEDIEAAIDEIFATYRETLVPEIRALVASYRSVDLARKVVGVGSVGTRAWVVLLEGRDERDPLVLQAKEAEASVLEAHLEPSQYDNHGERVVRGQRAVQAASDLLLGWMRATGIDGIERDFYIRQLWDGKASAEIETMPPERMRAYAQLCGWTLARAHARTGDRVAIAAYLGGGTVFDEAMVRFSAIYADQNERDFRAFEEAVESGRLAAQPGM